MRESEGHSAVSIPSRALGGRPLYLLSAGTSCSSWSLQGLVTFTFHFHALEKEMSTRSSIFAWRIPGAGEPGGLPSMGSDMTEAT